MVDISVITVTKRYGGIDIAADALCRQTFNGSWEWILVDELYNERSKEVQTHVDSRLCTVRGLSASFIHTPPKLRKPERKYRLANALNTGLLRAHGELIVWIQDYIWVMPTCLERYWKAYDAFPHKIIGGLKNHYHGPVASDLKGKVSIFDTPWEGDPAEKASLTEKDDRYKSIRCEPETVLLESVPVVYEMCNASMPYALAVALNGIDEIYDDGRGYDNQNISFRAAGLGYGTVVDMYNIAREFNHWEYFGLEDKVSQPSVNSKPSPDSNFDKHIKTMEAIRDGKYPLRSPNDFSLSAR